jgi:hypothetical protein
MSLVFSEPEEIMTFLSCSFSDNRPYGTGILLAFGFRQASLAEFSSRSDSRSDSRFSLIVKFDENP